MFQHARTFDVRGLISFVHWGAGGHEIWWNLAVGGLFERGFEYFVHLYYLSYMSHVPLQVTGRRRWELKTTREWLSSTLRKNSWRECPFRGPNFVLVCDVFFPSVLPRILFPAYFSLLARFCYFFLWHSLFLYRFWIPLWISCAGWPWGMYKWKMNEHYTKIHGG